MQTDKVGVTSDEQFFNHGCFEARIGCQLATQVGENLLLLARDTLTHIQAEHSDVLDPLRAVLLHLDLFLDIQSLVNARDQRGLVEFPWQPLLHEIVRIVYLILGNDALIGSLLIVIGVIHSLV